MTAVPAGADDWAAQRSITVDEARALIAAQFPELAASSVEPFGNGWDNTAYLVGGEFVFRFPRRAIAAPLILREIAILPLLAPALPVPIPLPRFAGTPGDDYPWPFAGYARLAGTTLCARAGAGDSAALARGLGTFVRALHHIDPRAAVERGLPRDEIGRLNHESRFRPVAERFAALHEAGVIADPSRLLAFLRAVAPRPDETASHIVHGDLYARHLLIDEAGELSGVIDWGDLHLGHPALDIAIADLVLEPAGQTVFFEAYGPVDARTRALARYRAIYHAALEAHYAWKTSDAPLFRAGASALERIGASLV